MPGRHAHGAHAAQITNAPRSSGKELAELHEAATELARSINRRWSSPGYEPVAYLERHVPLHERIAFYTVRSARAVRGNTTSCCFLCCFLVRELNCITGALRAHCGTKLVP